jgi:hypothetical protein
MKGIDEMRLVQLQPPSSPSPSEQKLAIVQVFPPPPQPADDKSTPSQQLTPLNPNLLFVPPVLPKKEVVRVRAYPVFVRTVDLDL